MSKKFYVLVFFLALMMMMPPTARTQNRQLIHDETQMKKRVALIIGNGAYTKAKSLPNPPNDAGDMTATLKSLGFEVLTGNNLDKRGMENLIREFGAKLSKGSVGLFYYAGHGIQYGGENYLVPIDAEIPEETEIAYAAVPVNLILRKMAATNNDLNVVILDACRNNPFARSWRGVRDNANNDGLAKISPPTGTLVLYATEPGKVASDGAGRNGLFTEALLKQIKRPNLEYDQMVKAVSIDVWQKSNKQQLPWKEGNSLVDFYFNPVTGDKGADQKVKAKGRAEQEKESWDLVKNSLDAADFREFLKEFSNGANSEQAKVKLEELVWFAVKSSNEKDKIKAYLKEFPSGANASAARIRLRQLEAQANNKTAGNSPPAGKKAGAISKSKLPDSLEMSFAYVPPGEFQMGDGDSLPVHKVKISRGFWMQQTEITQAQWKAVIGGLPARCDYGAIRDGFLGDDKPMICVSWEDAQEFVRQMNLKNDGYKYRLPTEAEWEYAARAGTTGDFAGYLDAIAWYNDNSGGYPHKIATKRANDWNLYDMHGNVFEWVQDWFGYYPSAAITDPTGVKTGTSRIIRGGSYDSIAENLRLAQRAADLPSKRDQSTGFRIVRE